MSGFARRFKSFWLGIDMAVAGACGAKEGETISGTAGRAVGAGGGKPKPWGPDAVALIDALFGKGHCVRQAVREAAAAQALKAAGLET